MKRPVLISSIFLVFVIAVAAVTQVELRPVDKFRSFQYQMNGKWLPDLNPLHVGPGNYTTLDNLRYTDSGLETVDGYTDITTQPSVTPMNSFQFKKGSDSHFILKSYKAIEDVDSINATGLGDSYGFVGLATDGTYYYVGQISEYTSYGAYAQLRAYSYVDNEFTLLDTVTQCSVVDIVVIGSYIFVLKTAGTGCADLNVIVYTFNGASFSLQSGSLTFSSNYKLWDMTTDGTYLYINYDNAIRAYSYNGSSFTMEDSYATWYGVENRGGTIVFAEYSVSDYIFATIYEESIADEATAIYVLTFNGSDLTLVLKDASIDADTVFSFDGDTVFCTIDNEIRSYSFNGTAFTLIDSVTISDVDSDLSAHFLTGYDSDGDHDADALIAGFGRDTTVATSGCGIYGEGDNQGEGSYVIDVDSSGNMMYRGRINVYNSRKAIVVDDQAFITTEYDFASYNLYDTTSVYLYDNDTDIPETGEFDTDTLKRVSSSSLGSFSNGPQGTMFYVDDQNDLITGGDEIRASVLLVSEDADADDALDLTENISNDDIGEIVTIAADQNDSYTELLLHCDGADASTTFTDSSSNTFTVTANGDAQLTTDYQRYGSASGTLDGTGDYLSVPDDAAWYMGSGDFTIDMWIKPRYGSSSENIFSQYVDAQNRVCLRIDHWSTGVEGISFYIYNGSAIATVSLHTSAWADSPGEFIPYDTWSHVAVERYGDYWYLYVNGRVSATGYDTDVWPDLAAAFTIGLDPIASDNFIGEIDEFRVSKGIARYRGHNFTPRYAAFDDESSIVFVGSPIQLNGVKFYVNMENTEISTLAGAEWAGSGVWSALNLTDNTSSSSVSLAQTGTVTWGYTDAAKIRYLNGAAFYWYRFTLSAGSADVYKITVSAPLQDIRDVWNGTGRTVSAFQASRSSVFEDYTFHVGEQDSSQDAEYAATLGGLTTNDYLIVMFDDRIMAMEFVMVAQKVNDSGSLISDIQYYNGYEFTSIGDFVDTTLDSTGTISLHQSGSLSWVPPPKEWEYPYTAFGKTGYAYKLSITSTFEDGTDHDGTSVDFIAGVTAPLDVFGYDAVGYYKGRVLLFDGNEIDYSQTNTPWCFNGVDSSDDGRMAISIDTQNTVTATTSIFNQYGSSLVEGQVITTDTETFILLGSQPYADINDYFRIQKVSSVIGCPAPMTMRTYQTDLGGGSSKTVALWLDMSGPVVFDGTSPKKIPGIENYFDKNNSECVNYEYIEKAVAYVDTVNNEYNLIFPSGTSVLNNTWLVYALDQNKWYRKVPSSYPMTVSPVEDANGGRYNYGVFTDGIMRRMDYGTTWDGTAIDQQVTTGEFSLPFIEGDQFGLWSFSKIRAFKLVSDAIDEDQDVTVSVYVDGTVSSQTFTIPLDSGSNVSRNTLSGKNIAVQGYTFQWDFQTSTSSDKWAPLAYGYQGQFVRED